MVRMTGTVDLTNQTDVQLTVDVDVSEMVAFEACLPVARVSVREGGVNRYTMDSSRDMNFMAKFHVLNGQCGFRREWGGHCGGRDL